MVAGESHRGVWREEVGERVKWLVVTGWMLLAAAPVMAQTTMPARPRLMLLRYEEDYSFLADEAKRTEPFDAVKYIELNKEVPRVWLSIGGEARTKYEYFREPFFGLRGLDRDDYLLQRLLLHGDLHVGENMRFFAQLVSGYQIDPETAPAAVQDDVLDVQQLFLELYAGDRRSGQWLLRAGRFELNYGSARLVSPREGTNVRTNFDGVLGRFQGETWKWDVFLTRPVEQEIGRFNDARMMRKHSGARMAPRCSIRLKA